MPALPALFVSHGAPTIALFPEAASDAWRATGAHLRRPRAILVATAHWPAPVPMLGSAARPATVHDFYGFPRPLYELAYPAAGAPDVARAALDLLRGAGFEAGEDDARGPDHGTWVPLRSMYPGADIPVAQIAIQPDADPAHHFAVGRALAPLARDGVLVVGSGGLTHNLRAWMAGMGRDGTPAWVTEFARWFAERAEAGDVDALLDYRRRAPHAAQNHPTDEHLLPFFVALGAGLGMAAGAKTEEASGAARRVHASTSQGVLAMDVYAFGERGGVGQLAEALSSSRA